MKEILAVAAAVAFAALLAATGAAAAIELTKTFGPVTMNVAAGGFDAGASARAYCKGKSYSNAVGYEFGVLWASPYNDVGRAYYVSINCIRGPVG